MEGLLPNIIRQCEDMRRIMADNGMPLTVNHKPDDREYDYEVDMDDGREPGDDDGVE